MLRHRAPSPALSYPVEIGSQSHDIAGLRGFVTGGCLLNPFGGFGFETDTAGGGGATSSCTVAGACETAVAGIDARTASNSSLHGGVPRIAVCEARNPLNPSPAGSPHFQRGTSPFASGADSAERKLCPCLAMMCREDPGERADSAECCLGGGGCKLRPPGCGVKGCGFGTGVSSSLSHR